MSYRIVYILFYCIKRSYQTNFIPLFVPAKLRISIPQSTVSSLKDILKGKRVKDEDLRSTDYAVILPEILLSSLKCQILLANINIYTEIYIELFITLIELNLTLS